MTEGVKKSKLPNLSPNRNTRQSARPFPPLSCAEGAWRGPGTRGKRNNMLSGGLGLTERRIHVSRVKAGPVRDEATQPDRGPAPHPPTAAEERIVKTESSQRTHPKALRTACSLPVASVPRKQERSERERKDGQEREGG